MNQTLKALLGGVLCLLATPLSMQAQNEPAKTTNEPFLDSVDVIARWILNDEGVYRITSERYELEDSTTVDSFENVMLCYVKVADSSANHYILDMNLKNDPIFKKNIVDYSQLENLSLIDGKELLCRLKTSEYGVPDEILNWDELKKTVGDYYQVLEKVVIDELNKKLKLDEDKKDEFRKRFREHISSDSFIKNEFFGGVIDMVKYHGMQYVLDSLFEYTDTTEQPINLLGEDITVSLPWNCQRFYSLDSNGVVLIEDLRELDVEGYIQGFIEKVKAANHATLAKENPQDIADNIRAQNLERQISSKHYIDEETGWTILTIDKDYFKQGSKRKIKVRTVEILDAEEKKQIEEKN